MKNNSWASKLPVKRIFSTGLIWLVILSMVACGSANPKPRTWKVPDVPFPFSQPGPYAAGKVDFMVIDASRNREIQVEIWYPALPESGADKQAVKYDAEPDKSGAPYPLILTEHRSARWIFESHLVSHGFVMAVITVPDHANAIDWDIHMIEWPRDFLASLDQLASKPPSSLKDLIDFNRVGVIGYSFGGDISLALAGARIDPAAYQAYCQKPLLMAANFEWYHQVTCKLADKWGQFSSAAGPTMTAGADGLWRPLTDSRIKAFMPMAPSGTWLYGERGLAAIDRPILVVASTNDEFIPYQEETAFLFEHLGTADKALVTFVGNSHMMVDQAEPVMRIKHFATAFFSYHLQNRSEVLKFISQDYIFSFDDLYWGIYPGE